VTGCGSKNSSQESTSANDIAAENSVNEESGIPNEVNSTDSFDLTIMGVNDAVNYISLNFFE